jgi:radical SAM superfamily enzyme YgiQ (UPF0313 family)
MLNHYTAAKRKRSDDAYTLGGKSGQRPDYATNVYTKILKEIYPEVPVVIGGIEASMRRFAHYDFWQDKIFKLNTRNIWCRFVGLWDGRKSY